MNIILCENFMIIMNYAFVYIEISSIIDVLGIYLGEDLIIF